ncbi:MAG: hypothetical protein M0P02_00335 [Sulfurospirillaceae bacterium]|nr:hypothetical protein [Sulfurospirillaceae bacterium]MCK9545900.1 hypothetical protein [Sulfurospirillaceae bacterium]MDY0238209.1 hypothetical protein [Campylobacterales bacterium]
MEKSPYSIYKAHVDEVLSDELYREILERAQKFGVSAFSNPHLAKNLCNIELKPSELNSKKARDFLKFISWLIKTRNSAQLSKSES